MSGGDTLAFRLATEGMAPAHAFDSYHAVFACGADARRESDNFAARISAREFARMQVHDRRLRNVRHLRDAAMVRRSDFSHFTLTLCLSGEVTGRSGDACWAVKPGELLLLDMRRPAELLMTEAHVLTVPMAREIVEAAIGGAQRFHAHVFPATAASPLREYLLGLMADETAASTASPMPFERVSQHLRTMLAGETPRAVERRRGERLLLAQTIIETLLPDPGFGVDDLARMIGISRAGLYRLFAPQGGVDRYITDRRVRRYQRLLVREHRRDSIALLSERAGWSSESHASRAFLDRVGERPGAFRRRLTSSDNAQLAAVMMRIWSSDLQ